MDESSVLRSYRRYARVYDLLFGLSLGPGRKEVLRLMALEPGQQVLEIGVGTGLSFGLYPPGVRLTGIDLSPEMLGQARRRAEKLGPAGVELHRMDARSLRFPAGTFDSCVAMYVASVTPEPEAMVREMRRVTKPGGRIFILNHFSRRGTFLGGLERALQPLASFIGFEPLFPLEGFLERTGLQGVEDRPVKPFGYWRILSFENSP